MRRIPLYAALAVLLGAALFVVLGCHDVRPPNYEHNVHLEATKCGGPGNLPCPTCVSCHGGIRESEERALPNADDCVKCHKPNRLEPRRGPNAGFELEARDGKIIFSHKQHLPMEGIRSQCVKCHAGVFEKDAMISSLPPMKTCLRCHKGAFERGECTTCHRRDDLVKIVPRTRLRHDVGFTRNHALEATQSETACSQCHAKSFCTDCHDTSQTLAVELKRPEEFTREFNHRGDWLTRHPIEARAQPSACLRCHTPSTCDACHTQRGISAGAVGSVNPHPRGWVGPNTQSRDFHGRAAKRDIIECAGCHDQGPATNCIRCHKVGGPGGNPHPGGWKSSQAQSSTMCRYCHGQ